MYSISYFRFLIGTSIYDLIYRMKYDFPNFKFPKKYHLKVNSSRNLIVSSNILGSLGIFSYRNV